MAEVECIAKKWGNSLGIVIPKNIVEQEHISENEKLTVIIQKKHFAREFFGILNDWKRPTKEILKEIREGWE